MVREVIGPNEELFSELVQPMGQGMGSRDEEVLERMKQLAEFVDGMPYSPEEKSFIYDKAFWKLSDYIEEGGLDPKKYEQVEEQIKGRF